MKYAWIIAKKEFARFFSSKTTAFATIFLPGILMATLYSVMGEFDEFKTPDDADTLIVAGENIPPLLKDTSSETNYIFKPLSFPTNDSSKIREAINDGKFDVYIVFPPNFEESIKTYNLSTGKPAPLVEIYFDPNNRRSITAFESLHNVLDTFETSLSNKFDINTGDNQYDVGNEKETSAKILSKLIPSLILLMLFQSIVSISAESIAGEKERGTIATILATPIHRKSIVLGKIITIASIASITALISMTGVIIGLRNIMSNDLDMATYNVYDYGAIALVLIPFALISSVLAVIISSLAKTTKEAQVYLSAAQIIITGLTIAVSMLSDSIFSLWWNLLPFFNTGYNLANILSLHSSMSAIIIALTSNLLVTVAGITVAEKIMNSERFMFQR